MPLQCPQGFQHRYPAGQSSSVKHAGGRGQAAAGAVVGAADGSCSGKQRPYLEQ